LGIASGTFIAARVSRGRNNRVTADIEHELCVRPLRNQLAASVFPFLYVGVSLALSLCAGLRFYFTSYLFTSLRNVGRVDLISVLVIPLKPGSTANDTSHFATNPSSHVLAGRSTLLHSAGS
jgi:hypothetical protein